VAPLQEFVTGPVRTMLLLLAGAAVVVLLVVCTNVANLRLAQAQARGREFAMRSVLGAGFGRLARQVLHESTLLALGGALLGTALARPILTGLLALYPGRLPRASEVRLDPTVILWSLAVAAAAGVLFAVPQLLQLWRADAGRLLKEGERGVASRGHRAARRAMVVVQLALSVVMLVSSGLLVRTFLRVTRVAPGFEAGGVLSFGLSAPAGRYQTLEATEQLYAAIDERVRAIPGVRMVAASNALPLTSNPWRNSVRPPGADPAGPGLPVNVRLVSPGYLELLRVPLRRGRPVAPTDDESSPTVVVVNEALARALWPDEDPIGKLLPIDRRMPREVIGVVGDVHHTSLTLPADAEVYIPFRQAGVRRNRVLAVRADGDLARLAGAIEAALHDVDAQLPVRAVRSLGEIVSAAVAPQRFRAAFIGSLAALALVLAVVGVYGVMSYTVSERRRELGIRVALGEPPARIRRRVVGEGLWLAALGGALGALGAVGATRALQSMMFEVAPGDPWTFASVAALLAVVAALAADGPARRAGRADPVDAIRGP
jgi:predicted permease